MELELGSQATMILVVLERTGQYGNFEKSLVLLKCFALGTVSVTPLCPLFASLR